MELGITLPETFHKSSPGKFRREKPGEFLQLFSGDVGLTLSGRFGEPLCSVTPSAIFPKKFGPCPTFVFSPASGGLAFDPTPPVVPQGYP